MEKIAVIRRPIEKEMTTFREVFDASLETSNPLLKEVLAYIRQRNGKMMRPMLTMLVAKAFGELSSGAYHAAATMEMLHTASLVHDDVVDESNERRGQPSVNSAFNNKISVLVGDYLLSTALHHASLTRNPDIVIAVSCLGQELSEGEILQLSNISNAELSETTYYEIIRKKTAALFATCAQLGAMSSGASAEQVETFRLYGEKVGICFQIKDDIFDYFDSPELGKPTGNDMLEGKLTLPAIHAVNTHGDDRARTRKVACRQPRSPSSSPSPRSTAASRMPSRPCSVTMKRLSPSPARSATPMSAPPSKPTPPMWSIGRSDAGLPSHLMCDRPCGLSFLCLPILQARQILASVAASSYLCMQRDVHVHAIDTYMSLYGRRTCHISSDVRLFVGKRYMLSPVRYVPHDLGQPSRGWCVGLSDLKQTRIWHVTF